MAERAFERHLIRRRARPPPEIDFKKKASPRRRGPIHTHKRERESREGAPAASLQNNKHWPFCGPTPAFLPTREPPLGAACAWVRAPRHYPLFASLLPPPLFPSPFPAPSISVALGGRQRLSPPPPRHARGFALSPLLCGPLAGLRRRRRRHRRRRPVLFCFCLEGRPERERGLSESVSAARWAAKPRCLPAWPRERGAKRSRPSPIAWTPLPPLPPSAETPTFPFSPLRLHRRLPSGAALAARPQLCHGQGTDQLLRPEKPPSPFCSFALPPSRVLPAAYVWLRERPCVRATAAVMRAQQHAMHTHKKARLRFPYTNLHPNACSFNSPLPSSQPLPFLPFSKTTRGRSRPPAALYTLAPHIHPPPPHTHIRRQFWQLYHTQKQHANADDNTPRPPQLLWPKRKSIPHTTSFWQLAYLSPPSFFVRPYGQRASRGALAAPLRTHIDTIPTPPRRVFNFAPPRPVSLRFDPSKWPRHRACQTHCLAIATPRSRFSLSSLYSFFLFLRSPPTAPFFE